MKNEPNKFCPYLPITEERKAICVGTGDVTITYFNPCLKAECMAYKDGKCGKVKNT